MIARLVESFTQTAADSATYASVVTNLDRNNKQAWLINAVEAMWLNSEAITSKTHKVQITLESEAKGNGLGNPEVIAGVGWARQTSGAVDGVLNVNPVYRYTLLEPRLTIKPTIFVGLLSVAAATAIVGAMIIYYDIIDLSDIDYLKYTQLDM